MENDKISSPHHKQQHTFYTTIFCSNENWKLYRAAAASEKVHNIYALEYLTTFGKILSIIYKEDVFTQANKSSFFDKTFKVKIIRLEHQGNIANLPPDIDIGLSNIRLFNCIPCDNLSEKSIIKHYKDTFGYK